MGGPQYQLNSTLLLRLAQAIQNDKLLLVPQIVVGGGSGGSGAAGASSNLVEAMLAMMMKNKVQLSQTAETVEKVVKEAAVI